MTLDQRSTEIIAQVAVKSAVELIGPTAFHDLPEEAFPALLEGTAKTVFDVIIGLATSGTAAVINQFPGAQLTPTWSSNVVPLQGTNAGNGGSGPAPVPGVASGSNSSDEAKWQRYFANPADYYDNRGNKQNPKSPDFKGKNGDKEALWIQSRGTPGWVYARFGQANPANASF